MAAAELRRLANDKAPLPVPSLQRWDKELVWIYCERCAAEQAMDVKSWKSSGDDSNSKLLDTASGRKKKKKRKSRNKNKKGWLVLHPINPAKSLFPSGCRDPRATFIYWQGLLWNEEPPWNSPIFVSNFFFSSFETRSYLDDYFSRKKEGEMDDFVRYNGFIPLINEVIEILRNSYERGEFRCVSRAESDRKLNSIRGKCLMNVLPSLFALFISYSVRLVRRVAS